MCLGLEKTVERKNKGAGLLLRAIAYSWKEELEEQALSLLGMMLQGSSESSGSTGGGKCSERVTPFVTR